MKISSFNLLFFISILTILFACGRKESLDEHRDYVLIRAIESTQNQTDKNIDIEALENQILLYEENDEKGKCCLANALIGYKLYLNCNFDQSLMHLKKAEANLECCDSIDSFVYSLIAKNLSTIDTLLALQYINKAILKNEESNNIKRLPYSYLDKSLLLKGDSAKFYLQKSLDLFDDWGDNVARCQFAYWHAKDMDPDSVIGYMRPCYDSIQFTGYASALAYAYIKKGDVDSAQIYVDRLRQGANTKMDFYYSNSQLLSLRGEYKEASEWWNEAFDMLFEECKFMLNQRLGVINSEYDMLYETLEYEKQRGKQMRIYNAILLVLLVMLIVTFVIIVMHKQNINKLEGDIATRKEKFNALFDLYKSDFALNKNKVVEDAMMNLKTLRDAYPTLTQTEVCIIWLIFMKCSSQSICELLNISQNYYYQRKTIICRTFNIRKATIEKIEEIVKEYIVIGPENLNK